jgi:hypothetical protein
LAAERTISGQRVVVYTAPGCRLCAPAIDVVRRVCGGDFAVVDITTDTALERQYRERIPVVEVDGVERFRFALDEDDLRSVL